jgi:hypothetical protein
MSLASTASPWTNDNIQPNRKRTPTIRKTVKIRPQSIEQTNLHPEQYVSQSENFQNLQPSSIEETEKNNQVTSNRVNELLNRIAAENDGNKLANFQPLENPSINIRKPAIHSHMEDEEMENESPSFTYPNELLPKTLEKQPSKYSANDLNLVNYSNYTNTYNSPRMFQGAQPYYAKMGIDSSSSQHDNKLMEKINYMIHLLEEQQYEKTANITEEFILYIFLGVFVIFTVDSFTRAGKYIR